MEIFKPDSKSELQTWVRKAFAQKTAFYPISGGKNWGNGSKTPWAPNCTLLDLSALNGITDFHEQLGYITVEPGVTQAQLVQFLKKNNSKLMPSLTGASQYASLIGNALERGDGFGLYAEHVEFICHLEILLPSGEFLRTGFDPQSQVAKLSRACLGPQIDGLFFQSNLGIITEATFWLETRPHYFHQAIFESSPSLEEIDILQRLQLQNLTPYVSIWNDEKLRSRIRDPKLNCAPWMGSITLFAPELELAEAQIICIKRALPKIRIVNGDLEFRHKDNTPLLYWKKPGPVPENPDPDRDGCGILWIMCLIPYQSQTAREAVQITESLCKEYNFEANLALLATNPRTLKLILALLYDRNQTGLDHQAQRCHDAILKKLIQLGYPPYRLGIQSAWASPQNSIYQSIKHCLDPNDLMSPGHYSPLPKRFSSRSSSSL